MGSTFLSLLLVGPQLKNHQHQRKGLPGHKSSVIATAHAVKQHKSFLCNTPDQVFDTLPVLDMFKLYMKNQKGKFKAKASKSGSTSVVALFTDSSDA